jgi:RNA polymerase sigma-70 factor (ECF subfamily)
MRPMLRLVPNEAPASADDAELVRRVREGDRGAEDALYRRHAKPTAGLIARLLGRREDVEDVLHDAFVTALTKIGDLREPSAFRPWLTMIAVTNVRRVLRRRRLMRALGLWPSSDSVSLEQLASRDVSPHVRAELAVVDGILARLPTDQRIAWMLRHVEGHRRQDVAELCGCSLATIKRRLSAAERVMSAVVAMEEG